MSPACALEVPGPGTGLGQVLLASDEDGVLSWHFPDDVAPVETPARGGDRRTYTIPRRVITEPEVGARGILGAIGKKVLKVLVFDLIDRVAGEVGDYFVSRWEAKQRPHRLRSLAAGSQGNADVPSLDPADLARLGEGRSLLFLHGTASRCHSALARLPDSVLERLNERYGGRVFGFDHPTISVEPTENARWLSGQVTAAGATLDLDLVAHSRGGLVARVLAEQPSAARVDPNSLRVGTVVFVATPNAGTALADFEHAGKLIDVLTNLLELVPDNPVTDPLEVILTLVKQLAVGALKGLDGLGSMNPSGDYLQKFLNVPSSAEVDYRGVASNFEPTGEASLARVARDAVTDAIFAPAHNDLVVPTEGVYAANKASTFPIQDPLLFAAEDGIDHSSFWTQPALHEAFDRWLTG